MNLGGYGELLIVGMLQLLTLHWGCHAGGMTPPMVTVAPVVPLAQSLSPSDAVGSTGGRRNILSGFMGLGGGLRKPIRDINFWGRALRIYLDYKSTQIRNRMSRKPNHEPNFNHTHEVNSRRMLNLCLSMRGFYLKTGQFLGTRHDFMPFQYIEKLSRLHDNVPPLSEKIIKRIIEKELGGPIEKFFSSIDLSKPVGSASIAQVHQGVWRASGNKVAVKVQYPTAERLMRGDLRNLRRLAEFLERTELKFDLLSAIKELQKQIGNEFDFEGEARNMEWIGDVLRKEVPEVQIPRLVFCTRRVLVMSWMDGSNLGKLAEYKSAKDHVGGVGGGVSKILRQRVGKKLLDVLSKAWGVMIFKAKAFNSDPHPGNIVVGCGGGAVGFGAIEGGGGWWGLTGGGGGGGNVGLLDWGQVKRVGDELAINFSRLVLAIKSKDEDSIVDAIFKLGVCVSNPTDKKTVKAIALTMLDTQHVPDYVIDPFDPRNSLKVNSVTKMPSDLYFIVRTVQLMRGICFAFDLDYSLAAAWAPLAKQVLYDFESQSPQS